MKIKYISATNKLHITLKDDKKDGALESKDRYIVHTNEKKEPIEIEIYNASGVVDLDEIRILLPSFKNKTPERG